MNDVFALVALLPSSIRIYRQTFRINKLLHLLSFAFHPVHTKFSFFFGKLQIFVTTLERSQKREEEKKKIAVKFERKSTRNHLNISAY